MKVLRVSVETTRLLKNGAEGRGLLTKPIDILRSRNGRYRAGAIGPVGTPVRTWEGPKSFEPLKISGNNILKGGRRIEPGVSPVGAEETGGRSVVGVVLIIAGEHPTKDGWVLENRDKGKLDKRSPSMAARRVGRLIFPGLETLAGVTGLRILGIEVRFIWVSLLKPSKFEPCVVIPGEDLRGSK